MGGVVDYMKYFWLYMLEPPWRYDPHALFLRTHTYTEPDGWHRTTDRDDYRVKHWLVWLIGWGWTLPGLVFGALVAPALIRFAGLSDTPYQDWLVIAVAVLAGILVQLLGHLVFLPFAIVGDFFLNRLEGADWLVFLGLVLFAGVRVLGFLAPIAGIGYALYRYFLWVGVDQRSVTIAFVGALLIKAFAIPLLKGIVTGTAFRFLMRWLRGGKETKNS